ncbi:hypothetical protein N665_1396s0003 [Sinapis alba]|nr:hypothetical protein N665_1396s0003 [Sinapis alba]
MVVGDLSISVFIYSFTAQAVTCKIFILAQNVSFTVTFTCGFNTIEERRELWTELSLLNASTPVNRSPFSVVGDFNQILRLMHHTAYPQSVVDTYGLEEMADALQDEELFEAHAKGSPFTWWNNQEDNTISTKIDHAFVN